MVLEPNHSVGRRMWSWLPPIWYARSRTALGQMEAQGSVVGQFLEDLAAVRDARLPQTASRWGLERLRVEVGLDEIVGESDADLRARIIARFRAWGSTIFRLKQIASAWQFGNVEIIPDPEAYNVWISFTGSHGLPADLAAHTAELRANVQAHLGIDFLITYLTWDDVRRSGVTWEQLVAEGITWERLRSMSFEELVAIAQGVRR